MAFGTFDPFVSVGLTGGTVVERGDLDALGDAVVRKDLVLGTADGDQLSRRDQTAEVSHIEVEGDIGDIVANAMLHCADRILVGAKGAGGHRNLDALVDGRGVDGCRAAARVAHASDLVGVNKAEFLCHDVNGAADVKDALADEGSAVEKRRHRGNLTAGALFVAAAFAESALLDGEGAVSLAHDLNGKVAVAAANAFLVAGIYRSAERDVEALRMSLQADDHGDLALLALWYPKNAGDKVSFLALKGESVLGKGVKVFFVLDVEEIFLCGGDLVKSHKRSQLRACAFLPFGKIRAAVVSPCGRDFLESVVMYDLRVLIVHNDFYWFLLKLLLFLHLNKMKIKQDFGSTNLYLF